MLLCTQIYKNTWFIMHQEVSDILYQFFFAGWAFFSPFYLMGGISESIQLFFLNVFSVKSMSWPEWEWRLVYLWWDKVKLSITVVEIPSFKCYVLDIQWMRISELTTGDSQATDQVNNFFGGGNQRCLLFKIMIIK